MSDLQELLSEMVKTEVGRQIAEMQKSSNNEKSLCEKRLVTGIESLAKYLGRSVPTINRWKAQGLLDGCFSQVHHSVVFDLDLVDSILLKR